MVAYPGAEVVVGTDLAGTIVVLKVQEKERVRRGQLLAELRSDDHRAALAEARARVREADADIRLAEAEVERARVPLGEGGRLPAGGRQGRAGPRRRRAPGAPPRAATADRLEAVLAKTRILSPIDGVVIARHAEPARRSRPARRS